jgi:hypothetical protein
MRALIEATKSNKADSATGEGIGLLRELARSGESLSAQQLAEVLDEPVRPPVASCGTFLCANDKSVFAEVRRGGFVIGRHYRLV